MFLSRRLLSGGLYLEGFVQGLYVLISWGIQTGTSSESSNVIPGVYSDTIHTRVSIQYFWVKIF